MSIVYCLYKINIICFLHCVKGYFILMNVWDPRPLTGFSCCRGRKMMMMTTFVVKIWWWWWHYLPSSHVFWPSHVLFSNTLVLPLYPRVSSIENVVTRTPWLKHLCAPVRGRTFSRPMYNTGTLYLKMHLLLHCLLAGTF